MTVLLLGLVAIFLILYGIGVLIAYGCVTSDEAEPRTLVQIIWLSLGSWYTLVLSARGEIQ